MPNCESLEGGWQSTRQKSPTELVLKEGVSRRNQRDLNCRLVEDVFGVDYLECFGTVDPFGYRVLRREGSVWTTLGGMRTTVMEE